MSVLPKFLRRRILVHRIEAALRARDFALAALLVRDPLLDGEGVRASLAAPIHAALAREAETARDLGDVPRLEAALARLEGVDAAAALALRERLGPLAEPARGAALVGMLAQMRAQRRADAEAPLAAASAPQSPHDAEPGQRACLARLSIDDAGEHLIASGRSIVLGHVRSKRADLAFLGDVDLEHARLVLTDAFHEGPCWRLESHRPKAVRVGGTALAPNGVVLRDGDEVELSRNVGFRFRAPSQDSASALLELTRGCECSGAAKVLLLAPGPGGVVRIGPRRARHVVVGDLAHDVTLELVATPPRVRVASDGLVRVVEEAAGQAALEFAWPIERLVRLRASARREGSTPFELTLAPLDPLERMERGGGKP